MSYKLARFLLRFKYFSPQIDWIGGRVNGKYGNYMRKFILWFDFGKYSKSWRVNVDPRRYG